MRGPFSGYSNDGDKGSIAHTVATELSEAINSMFR
jgi:hypothetical protein